MTDNSAIDRIQTVFQKYNSFVLTSHIHPDGDGLGSELALYHYLKCLGKSVHIINESPVPPSYQFMDPDNNIFKQYDNSHGKMILGIDVVIVLDISVMHRLGAVGKAIEQSEAIRLCIDHHLSNSIDADIVLIDENAVATGELVYNVLKQGSCTINVEMAEALYIALLSDTGCFRFSNTNERAFKLGADLLKLGVDHQKLYKELFENNSWKRTRLYAKAIGSLECFADGKIAFMYVSNAMLKDSGASHEDIEGFAEFSKCIKGVQISVLFVEQRKNNIKLSFRSVNNIGVDKLAGQFRGGGHKNASAAILHSTTLENAKKKILNAAHSIVTSY